MGVSTITAAKKAPNAAVWVRRCPFSVVLRVAPDLQNGRISCA